MVDPVPFHGTHYRDTLELQMWTSSNVEAALEPDLPIVDPHHHLWDDDRGLYLIEQFVADTMSGHNVVSTIYAQYRAMYRADGPTEMKPVGEAEFVNGQAATGASGRYGTIRVAEAMIAYADLLRGDDALPVLEALVRAGNGRLRAIRHGATWDDGAAAHGRSFGPRGLLADPQFHRGFAHLAPLGLSFDAWLFYHQLPDLAILLEHFPETTVILDHCGGLLGTAPHLDRSAVFEEWKRNIEMLAAFPNLSVKIGGLGMLYLGWDFHLRETPPSSEELADAWRPYVETCIDTFGVERCMFESNFPMDKQSCSYVALWNAFKRITAHRPAAEKTALYHDNAVRTYRLPRPLIGRPATA
ncbi:amidohydrolase family protein [Novosphingobium sp. 11B]